MAGEVTFESVNGLSKRVYDSTVKNAIPESNVLQRLFPLSDAARLGDTYQQSVVLDPPNGITYEGSDGSVMTLVNPEGMIIKQASLAPSAISLREQSAMAAFSRIQSQGEGALAAYIGQMMIAMKSSISNRVEASLLRGQSASGCGVVEAVSALVDTDKVDVTFTEASFSAGLFWAFGGRSKWATWQSNGTVRKNVDGDIKLTRVNARTRTVRFQIVGAVAVNFAVGDRIFPYTARVSASAYRECVGLVSQASNTTGASLGIDAGVYPTWAGNTADVAGNFSRAALESYCSDLRDRGAEGTILALVPNRLWGELSAELQAAYAVSPGTSKGRTGFKSLTHATKDLGDIELIAHPFLPLGEAVLVPEADVARVGSSDVVFGVPGRSDEMWQYVQDKNAVELRCYTDQAILLRAPSHAYALTGISYS